MFVHPTSRRDKNRRLPDPVSITPNFLTWQDVTDSQFVPGGRTFTQDDFTTWQYQLAANRQNTLSDCHGISVVQVDEAVVHDSLRRLVVKPSLSHFVTQP